MKQVLALLTLLLLLAGCTAPTPKPTNSEEPETELLESLIVDVSYSDCNTGSLIILLDKTRTLGWLPPGYTAADAATLIDIPAASDRAALFVSILDCQNIKEEKTPGTYVLTMIYVNEPHRQLSLELPSADYNFYETFHYTDDEDNYQLHEALGWDSVEMAFNNQFIVDALGETMTLTAEATHSNRFEYELQTASLYSYEYNNSVRAWRETEYGYGFIDNPIIGTAKIGKGECTLHPDSDLVQIIKTTSCPVAISPDQETTLSLAFINTDYPAQLQFFFNEPQVASDWLWANNTTLGE